MIRLASLPNLSVRLDCQLSSDNAFDRSFCVYFCMFPVCPLFCFIVISMDPVSEIHVNDDDDDVIKRIGLLLETFCCIITNLCNKNC